MSTTKQWVPSFIEDLVGKRLRAVKGCEVNSDEIMFTVSLGEAYRMYHHNDCCERVAVHTLSGNINRLIGRVIMKAYESDQDLPPDSEVSDASHTWTQYILEFEDDRRIRIIWLGESNGYYSEIVSFEKLVDVQG